LLWATWATHLAALSDGRSQSGRPQPLPSQSGIYQHRNGSVLLNDALAKTGKTTLFLLLTRRVGYT
jgi:hypothetical protein